MEKKHRNTAQRSLILEAVRESYDHPDAEKIYMRVLEKAPQISLGTVYRNLALLEKMGEIKKVSSPYGADHYDFNLENHFHFFCKECGEVYDVPDLKDEDVSKPNLNGFDIQNYLLTYFGVCPKCNSKKEVG